MQFYDFNSWIYNFQWVTSDLFTNIDDKKSVSDLSL